jgi:hypothetical protein
MRRAQPVVRQQTRKDKKMNDLPPTLPRRAARWLRMGMLALGCVSAPLLALTPARTPPPEGGQARRIAPPVMPPLRLVVPEASTPINLERVKVRTEVNGTLAQTTIELTFHNPNARQLEGELQFPLAPGQTVSGFAMDFNGVLREAMPVEKARGQAIFEDVTRQRVDPALLQVTEGNNFKLRVYPLMPRQNKTVVLRIAESLAGAQSLRLPLVYAGRAGALDFEATLRGIAQAPRPAGLLQGARLEKSGEGWHVSLQQADARLAGAAEIALVPAAQPATLTERFDGETFFYAQPRIAVPGVATAPRALPRQTALLWDSSGSGAERDHAREFALLDAYFKRAGNMRVNLVRFRESAEPAETFEVAAGDWSALRRALESVAYDGATRLPEPALIGEAGEALLFTDGLQNFGAGTGNWSKPVYAVSAAHKRNAARLQQLAEASGARFIDLMASNAPSAAAQLLERGVRVIEAGGEGLSDVVLASAFPRDGRIAVAGKLADGGGRLRLRIALPDGRETVMQLPVNAAENSVLAARAWAQLRVDALDAEYSINRGAIKRLGQRFGLVTRETSLIILDTAADYARYEVEPPAELRAEVERIRATAMRQRGTDRSAHLEQVVRQFEQKQAWWNKEFPKGGMPAPRQEKKAAMNEAARDSERRADMPRPAPMAPPPPPPAPAPAQIAPAAEPRMAESAVGRAMSRVAPGAAKADASASGGAPAIAIQLKKATPDAPYARRLREADAATRYRVYLDERGSYTNSTAFFLDAADIFFDKGDKALGLRILGNLAEMDLENRHILRILGYRLLQAEAPQLAVPIFEKVLELSPDEPQSYRDLGLAYAALGKSQQAVDKLYEVVTRPWHNRFPGIELIALAELNAVIANASVKPDVSAIDARLLKNLSLDIRTVLTWDADNTDIDLWVTDPNGEKAYYGHQLTYQGGRMSQDFTGGYGPEEFSLKDAKPGKYRIEAQFYGHNQQVVAGATTLQLKLQTGFGKPGMSEKLITLRLAGRQEVVFVGEFEVPAK